jgi:hypothetical protein
VSKNIKRKQDEHLRTKKAIEHTFLAILLVVYGVEENQISYQEYDRIPRKTGNFLLIQSFSATVYQLSENFLRLGDTIIRL